MLFYNDDLEEEQMNKQEYLRESDRIIAEGKYKGKVICRIGMRLRWDLAVM